MSDIYKVEEVLTDEGYVREQKTTLLQIELDTQILKHKKKIVDTKLTLVTAEKVREDLLNERALLRRRIEETEDDKEGEYLVEHMADIMNMLKAIDKKINAKRLELKLSLKTLEMFDK